jgi:hypothetical protein
MQRDRDAIEKLKNDIAQMQAQGASAAVAAAATAVSDTASSVSFSITSTSGRGGSCAASLSPRSIANLRALHASV